MAAIAIMMAICMIFAFSGPSTKVDLARAAHLSPSWLHLRPLRAWLGLLFTFALVQGLFTAGDFGLSPFQVLKSRIEVLFERGQLLLPFVLLAVSILDVVPDHLADAPLQVEDLRLVLLVQGRRRSGRASSHGCQKQGCRDDGLGSNGSLSPETTADRSLLEHQKCCGPRQCNTKQKHSHSHGSFRSWAMVLS